MSTKWSLVQLGEVLTPAAREEIVDGAKDYRLLGVRLDGRGPFLREVVSGAQTAAAKLYKVAAGDFIYSRLFACRGAFGVIEEALDGCYVSGEFPTFAPVADRLDASFLGYWFRLPSTLARVIAGSSGSTPLTRNRFNEKHFSALEIPLPPVAEQRRLVARIEEIAAQVDAVHRLRRQSDDEMKLMLHGAFDRIADGASRRSMGEVAPLVRRAVEVDPRGTYPELGIRSFGKGTFHKPALSGLEVGGKRLFRIEQGDLLFSNVFAWEGAIAVARPEDGGRFGSHRFISCVPKVGVAIASFLCFYLLTPEGLSLIGAASPGGAGRNRTLGLDSLAAIEVPVPPLNDQQWFDGLLREADAFRRLRAATAAEVDALVPAVLARAFKGEL